MFLKPGLQAIESRETDNTGIVHSLASGDFIRNDRLSVRACPGKAGQAHEQAQLSLQGGSKTQKARASTWIQRDLVKHRLKTWLI